MTCRSPFDCYGFRTKRTALSWKDAQLSTKNKKSPQPGIRIEDFRSLSARPLRCVERKLYNGKLMGCPLHFCNPDYRDYEDYTDWKPGNPHIYSIASELKTSLEP